MSEDRMALAEELLCLELQLLTCTIEADAEPKTAAEEMRIFLHDMFTPDPTTTRSPDDRQPHRR